MLQRKRPVFLQLHHIHLPLTGLLSISHRITGALLFLSLPLWLYLLQHSLASAQGHAEVLSWLTQPALRLLWVLGIWWFLHHLLAGVRLLLLDVDIGVTLPQARASAQLLLWISPVLLFCLLVWL